MRATLSAHSCDVTLSQLLRATHQSRPTRAHDYIIIIVVASIMDKQNLDLLLQARTNELQHEYENLVRSLDAAYEAVKAIGRDIAENRAEARRLFDTRLKLARGDDLEAVLRLCGDATTTTTTTEKNVTNNNNNNNVGKQVRKNDQMVRLYVKPQLSDAMSATATAQKHVEAVPPQRVVAVTPSVVNESLPRLRSIKQTIQPYDAASLLIEQLQQQQKQHQQHEQPHYSPVYVGDDHSYAVNEDEEEDLAEHQLMLEERLMVEAGDAKRRRYRESHGGGVDLSIVKTECLENSIEEQNPLVDHQTKIVKPVTKNPKMPGTLSKRVTPKIRKCLDSADDELNRKRKQTRERMRRWRAKRKMEESYKYKLVIAKTANV